MRSIAWFCLPLMVSLLPVGVCAKETAPDPEFDEILSQDIFDLNVTSVAKRSQRLSDTAAAVYVITQEDLRRAGIYSIPEALRLVPGMQVAKLSGDRWAVSARGFNSTLNNKLLVLIDGRAIYTPIFSGVYWGDQATSVNDIDRIEVVRGPGASLYGANAVNGVINIITKSAEDTQGNMLSATTSMKGNGVYEVRHGGKAGDHSYYRGYAQYYDAINWYRGRGGFRIDGKADTGNSYTVQGDFYGGSQNARTTLATLTPPFTTSLSSNDDAYGANILGRWNHKISHDSEISVQSYIDHYSRLEAAADQHVSTADIQLQHSLRLNPRNQLVWGAGARVYFQDLVGTYIASARDRYDNHEIFSTFVQDEYALVPDRLYLTAGSKFEYNDFTGFELQPSIRATWHPTDNQTVWGAVSRAVRTPSSIEQDVSLLALVTAGPTEKRIFGRPQQDSEELIAYEIGHRIQPANNVSFDTALFFNDYSKLQTISGPGAAFTGSTGNTVIPYTVTNLGMGHVYGAELTANWNVSNSWRLAGSYSYLKMSLAVKPGAGSIDAGEDLSPSNQFAIQSYYNLTETVHWDNMLYYVDDLSGAVNAYMRYDTRLAWLAQPGLEISLIGRNLINPHPEFPSQPQSEIGHSIIGQALWKF